MALIECEIVPNPGACPDEFRQLGAALARWSRRESGDDGILQFISRDVLANLAYGKPPPTFLSQYQDMLDESKAIYANPKPLSVEERMQRDKKLREELGDERALRRLVYFQVRGGAYANRASVIQSLRQDVPAELVAEVLIDSRNWDQ